MKKTIILSLFILLVTMMSAVRVDVNEALSIASGWIRTISAANSVRDIQTITNPHDSSIADLYVVRFTQGGFIIISADDKANPVLGYDTSAEYNLNLMPDNVSWFLSQYHDEISSIRAAQNLSVHPAWQAVRIGNFSSFIPTRPVSPLLTTNWDQDWPYNSMCPTATGGPGGHVYAGCGATTMAQIMKYWQYPTQGIGTHTYTHPTYGILSANFGATTYNYASMPNQLYYTVNTPISTLMFHCGVALDMDYAIDGSGATINSVRPAFINYFGYETTAQTVYKASYSTLNYETLLKTELDNGRPIFYFGTDNSYGGHAWVMDGYQGTNYFHMNWGWSGYNNGYYYVSNLNPGIYQFNSQQGGVIGLRPTLPITAPSNLVATVDAGNNVFLEWQSPLTRALLGYTIYKDGSLYATVTDPLYTNYYDINIPAGSYEYYVVANYSQGDSQPSNSVTATIYPAPVINYQDSFESLSDFTDDLSPWFAFDVDNAATIDFDYFDFPAEGSQSSFIVFNPDATTPPVSDLTAFNGQKFIACLPALNTANNDWFVSPKWNTGNQGRLRFWAKSAFADSGLAQIKVGISTIDPVPANMTIVSGANAISVPEEWTGYDYIFSSNLYSNVFVGIQCLSGNGSMLLLDRFQLWSSYVENDDEYSSLIPITNLSNFPNPFQAATEISWQQKTSDKISLRIYDLKGRLVRSLTNETKSAGIQKLTWDGKDNNGKQVASGIYYSRLTDSNGKTATQKMMLIK